MAESNIFMPLINDISTPTAGISSDDLCSLNGGKEHTCAHSRQY
jgi:hypothetical protein